MDETLNWFMREVKQYFQVNFVELESCVQQSGFNTIPLQVQYHKKFSVPLFAVIMALISVPFSFAAGARGGMAGVAGGLVIMIAYLSVSKLFSLGAGRDLRVDRAVCADQAEDGGRPR